MTAESFLNGKVKLLRGDCLELLPTLEADSIDSCVTNPPYGLEFMGKDWDKFKTYRGGNPNIKPQGKAITSLGGGFGVTFGYRQKNPRCRRCGKLLRGNGCCKCPDPQPDTRHAESGNQFQFFCEDWAREIFRVLKPGAHLVAFGGTRTYHRMACAIEDAGFEIRDQLGFAYGSGFPKSHNISRNLDHARCSCEGREATSVLLQHDLRSVRDADLSKGKRTEKGEGEALLAGLPQQGSPATGRAQPSNHARPTESSMEGRGDLRTCQGELSSNQICQMPSRPSADNGKDEWLCDGSQAGDGSNSEPSANTNGMRASRRSQPAQQSSIELGALARQSEPQISGAWSLCSGCGKPVIPDGLGSALKPAWEPIVLARKPLSESSIAANVLKHGTGAINIDGCRIASEPTLCHFPTTTNKNVYGEYRESYDGTGRRYQNNGRWPANLILDGSEEVVRGFPDVDTHGGGTSSTGFWQRDDRRQPVAKGDSGSAARFFYTAKADSDDRLGSRHPTVKPLDLMQYLVRLITPKGGTCLDPFAGTGTTGEAAWREGMVAMLIEREPEYQADIVKRMGLCLAGPDQRAAMATKQEGPETLPLFHIKP